MTEPINLSGNSVSRVWVEGDYIFKKQPKYLADNEQYALEILGESGFVPKFLERIDDETIRMEHIRGETVTNQTMFQSGCSIFIGWLFMSEIRHGDLTMPHILVVDNSPKVIDWAESRIKGDPRPDKRREGDVFWLLKTMHEILGRDVVGWNEGWSD